MNQPTQKISAPPAVTISGPPPKPPAKRNRNLQGFIRFLEYILWPQWALKYLVYMRWAKGNEDRLDAARKKFLIWLSVFAGAAIGWWIVFFVLRGWELSSLFHGGRFLFLFVIWSTFTLPMNIFALGTFVIPDWTPLLTQHKRLHWTEFPEPTANDFALGTDGRKWIPYGWLQPLYERTGKAIIGDLGKGRPNAMNYLIACGFGKADTLCFCLDGKPASGVGFRHLRGLKHVFIAEEYETIIKTVKWLAKILAARIKKQSYSKDQIDFPRVLIVCDEEVSQTFLPGFFIEREHKTVYKWPAVHKELIEILHNGHGCDMHIIAAIEPSETWLLIDNKNRPYFEEIDLYYSLPRETEKGMVWIKPHDHPYLDVFSVKVDGEKVIGKMPNIPDNELSQWIEIKAAMAGSITEYWWNETIEKLPLETVGEKIERDEMIWVGDKLVLKSVLASGQYKAEQIDRGAQEEFYQIHHAPKYAPSNGTNGANGNGEQGELEIEKAGRS